MKKKILLSLVLMCISIFAFGMLNVLAYTGTKYGNLYYTKSNGEVTITDCDESATVIEIPAEIDGKSVISIGDSAFYGCSELTSITIPDSVTKIGVAAFKECTRVTTLTVGKNVSTIGYSAFDEMYNLKTLYWNATDAGFQNFSSSTCYNFVNAGKNSGGFDVYYGKDVQKIPSMMFCAWGYGIGLGEQPHIKNLNIHKNIKKIGYSLYPAFCKCKIDNINIESIESWVSIYFPSDTANPMSYAENVYLDGKLLTELIIPGGITSINSNAFSGCKCLENVTIPEGITKINRGTFKNCSNLNCVTIPKSIKEIHDEAFSGTSKISRVNISDMTAWCNIDYIDCEYGNPISSNFDLYVNEDLVTDLIIPNTITSLKLGAFSGCKSLKSVLISEGVELIGKCVFSECEYLESITLPNSLSAIGEYAFESCYALTGVIIPDNVISIGRNAFCYCKKLTDVTIPDSVTEIGIDAFYSCSSLTSITIPDSVATIGNDAFGSCISLKHITIPNCVTKIGNYTFSGCTDLTNITIPNSVTEIGDRAFDNCNNLSTVYYNGTEEQWNKITISSSYNTNLTNAKKIYFAYVTFFDENGKELSKNKYPLNSYISISDFEEKSGHTLNLFTNEECTNKFDLQTPITENATLYLKYVINKYTYKFLDEDNKTVLKEETVDYGTIITPPENPRKQGTQKYSYSFTKWNGYTDGMKLEDDTTFTAQYQESINKYTYKFFDEDNKTVLKEETVDYGTVIIPPEIFDKTEYYLFDYWKGYTTGAELTDDIEFTAVYKYKNYKVTATGLTAPVTVTYNSNYTVEPQTKDGYNFIGYFTEADGKGTQITNEKGESLKAYDVVGDLTVYPYFYSGYMNKVELQGVATAMPGDTIKQNAIFATDKEAMYVTATVKYPEYLNFKSISSGDFAEASKDSETLKDGYKYLDITCLYDYNGGNMPINQNLIPFEITFDVATNATIENANISIENVTLIGNDEYSITDLINNIVEIKPKLAENISITGNNSIDKTTKYTATVSPEYTTNKAVTWSVDNEEIATISQDGTLTPHKNGTVKVTATSNDGSGKYDTKTVNVTAYATITALECNGIAVEIISDKYYYTVYVKNDTTKISLTPTYSGGTLKLNGSGIWPSGKTKEIDLTDKETTVTLNRNNVPGMTDNAYTITIVKFEGTKTTVSTDGKKFTIKPINIAKGNTVILALYNDDMFVEMQSATYNGEDIPFTTSESYTKAKVFVWSNLTDIMPICDVEIIE